VASDKGLAGAAEKVSKAGTRTQSDHGRSPEKQLLTGRKSASDTKLDPKVYAREFRHTTLDPVDLVGLEDDDVGQDCATSSLQEDVDVGHAGMLLPHDADRAVLYPGQAAAADEQPECTSTPSVKGRSKACSDVHAKADSDSHESGLHQQALEALREGLDKAGRPGLMELASDWTAGYKPRRGEVKRGQIWFKTKAGQLFYSIKKAVAYLLDSSHGSSRLLMSVSVIVTLPAEAIISSD
jgi:hypothetical protein